MVSERLRAIRTIWRGRIWEYLLFDSWIVAFARSWLSRISGTAAMRRGSRVAGLKLLSTAHRTTRSSAFRNSLEQQMTVSTDGVRSLRSEIIDAGREYLRTWPGSDKVRARNLLGTRALVLKASRPGERGILLIDYAYAFPLFAAFFNIETVSRHYHIVLEPSWIGYCIPEILAYAHLETPVFVETVEPPDRAFLEAVGAPFVPVPVAANWWVDHRMVRPLGTAKDIDVCMVAAWSRFKRHAAVFTALATLRRRGVHLKTLLIGYVGDRTLSKDDVYQQAKYYGVADLVEMQEHLPLESLVAQLNRAKTHLLWSRREGFNRATIEALAVDIPVILREGHNYGFSYRYINEQTGMLANEASLPSVLHNVVETYTEFTPRAWLMEHMTPQIATSILGKAIRDAAVTRGETWTTEPVAKVVELTHARYWDPADRERFAADYEFLKSPECEPR
jgi:hypothetical protein